MMNPLQWVWASAQVGASLVGASPVPIRSLHAGHREAVRIHLHKLDANDRHLRFGYAASDAQISRYVDSLDFEHDRFFGVFGHDAQLLAMAHLAMLPPNALTQHKQAEFGVSVEARARAQGMGRALYNRAALHARNVGIAALYIFVLRENTAMLRIARAAHAEITGDHDELDCWATLLPATMETRLAEFWEEQRAQVDYQIKQTLPYRAITIAAADPPPAAPRPRDTVSY